MDAKNLWMTDFSPELLRAGARERGAAAASGRHPAGASGEDESCVRPLVSVILAIRNEASMIGPCLNSLLEQETQGFDLEILAVDGDSTDGTWELVVEAASRDSRIRALRNEKRRTPFAFNLGLREAKGEYVAILGAHTLYARNYISVCLHELTAQGAAGCAGRVITEPAGDTLQARLVAAALCHPFGSSRKSFRTQGEGFVDSVGYPVVRKSALLEVGGYDEELLRNQDNDVNQKLRAKGYPLYCTWQTDCIYQPRGNLRGLMSYAYGNGFWNLISFRRNPAAMASRHFIPFLFLLALLATGLLAMGAIFLPPGYAALAALPFFLLVGLHVACGSAAAVQVSIRERRAGALWLPLVFLGFHLSYGFGTLRALLAHAGSTPRQKKKSSDQSCRGQEGSGAAPRRVAEILTWLMTSRPRS